jgi:hypothetical protein
MKASRQEISDFRREIKKRFPGVRVSVRTVSFAGFGYDEASVLSFPDGPGGHQRAINRIAGFHNIIPDKGFYS